MAVVRGNEDQMVEIWRNLGALLCFGQGPTDHFAEFLHNSIAFPWISLKCPIDCVTQPSCDDASIKISHMAYGGFLK